MKCGFAVLADYVSEGRDGKLSISGIFDRIYSESVPAVHLRSFLVARFTARVVEGTEHTVRVHMVDADGREVMPMTPSIPIKFQPTAVGGPLVGQLIVEFAALPAPSFGDFEMNIVGADGEQLASVLVTIYPATVT